MPPSNGLKLAWDGSHLGDIDIYVTNDKKVEMEGTVNLLIKTNSCLNKIIQVKIFKYKDDVPLIADELKRIFGVSPIGKHRVRYFGDECIINKYVNDIPIEEFMKYVVDKSTLTPLFINEMRNIFAFRYLVCLNCNYENKINIRTDSVPYPISYQETTFSLFADKSSCRIPKTIIKEWFDNDDMIFYDTVNLIMKDKDPMLIKFEVESIIRKYNDKYIGWVNSIYDRIMHIN